MLPNITQKLQSLLKYLYIESKTLNFEDFNKHFLHATLIQQKLMTRNLSEFVHQK